MNKNLLLAALFLAALFFAFYPSNTFALDDPNTPTYAYATPPTAAPAIRNPNVPRIPGGMWLWDSATGIWYPASGNASGVMQFTGNFSVINSTGILGTATLSIPLGSAVALPTAPSGAKDCYIMPTQDVNWGSTTVASGTGHQYLFADIPGQGFFGYSAFTSIRLIGRTAVATATIIWR